MHNIHVTILVLHLYNVILKSIFIRVINDTAKSNIERYSAEGASFKARWRLLRRGELVTGGRDGCNLRADSERG